MEKKTGIKRSKGKIILTLIIYFLKNKERERRKVGGVVIIKIENNKN